MEVVQTCAQDPIVKEFNKGSVIVRRRVVNSDSGIDLFILERTDYGVKPADFMRVLEKVEYYAKANSNLKGIDLITVEDLQDNGLTRPVEVYASYIKAPNAFISGRIIFDAKFIFPKEDLVIFTSDGNEDVARAYLETHQNEVKGLAQANTNMSGFKFFPVMNEANTEIVGTRVYFLNESDFGGSMPKWFLQKFTPGGIHEFYEDLIREVKAFK